MKPLLVGLSLAASVASSAPASAASTSEERAVRDIRRRYAAINALVQRGQHRSRALEGFSTEGGELRLSTAASARRVRARLFGCSGPTRSEYFFWRGRLVFAFVASQKYLSPATRRVVRREEERLYFHRGRLVRWLASPHEPWQPRVTRREREREVLADARQWLRLSRA